MEAHLLFRLETDGAKLSLVVGSEHDRQEMRHHAHVVRGHSFDCDWYVES